VVESPVVSRLAVLGYFGKTVVEKELDEGFVLHVKCNPPLLV
jgi:hypothetical protein